MMYGNKLAAAIKVNGKVLREFKDTVHIPFGSEYQITIKNLHTQRAVASVYLDGENVVPGGLVIDPGRSIDLERWIKNGNLSEGNKFKFIERTGAIEDGPRGIKLEDGLVRIEYQYELPAPNWNSILRGVDKGWITASGATYSSVSPTSATLNSVNVSQVSMDSFVNDVGITVPGSKSEQKFGLDRQTRKESRAMSNKINTANDEAASNRPVMTPQQFSILGGGRIAYVTDGDTFRLESGERIRIAGIDAPELHRNQAKCAREVERGQDAPAADAFRRRTMALTASASLSGLPQISLPIRTSGAPFGLSLMGRRGSDRNLLAFAKTLLKDKTAGR